MVELSERQVDEILDRDTNIVDLLDHAPVLIAVNDTNGMFRRLNRQWESVTGFSRRELCSKSWVHFIHPNDIQKSIDQYENGEMFNSDAPLFKGFVNRYKVKSGGWIVLEWYSTGLNIEGLNIAIAIPKSYESE